jgi:SAM-dependent methyltransferase
MDRAAWLRGRRAAIEREYDAEAAGYDQLAYPVPLHATFVDRLLGLTTPGGVVLDAPCGTGRYFAQVVASGRSVVGIDQSAGMLAQARMRGLADRLIRMSLQELAFDGGFDGAMTIDAMENIPPEDWLHVVTNLRRALRRGGHLYLTVEEVDADAIARAAADQAAHGLPSVEGEVVEGDTAGYHYYPGRERVIAWLDAAGLGLVEEAFDQQNGWGYRHLIVRAGPA